MEVHHGMSRWAVLAARLTHAAKSCSGFLSAFAMTGLRRDGVLTQLLEITLTFRLSNTKPTACPSSACISGFSSVGAERAEG